MFEESFSEARGFGAALKRKNNEKENSCKDKVATITALWKAELPCAERKVRSALTVEGLCEVNPWPGTANTSTNGAHSGVRGSRRG